MAVCYIQCIKCHLLDFYYFRIIINCELSDMTESCSFPFESFLGLDILGDDFCPHFDIHDDSYLSVSQLSTKSSDALEIDLQEELDNMLEAKGSASIFDKSQKVAGSSSNENDIFDQTVKEEEDDLENFLNNNYLDKIMSIPTSDHLNQYMSETSSMPLKEEDCEDFLSAKVELPNVNISKPITSYVRHIQPMPDRTSPLPQSSKRMLSQANHQVRKNFLGSGRLEEKEVTYLGRSTVPLKQLKKTRPGSNPQTSSVSKTGKGHVQGRSRSLLKSIPPQLKAHSLNPILGSVNSALTSPEIYLNPQDVEIFHFPSSGSSNAIFMRRVNAKASKFRKGVSVLKPVSSVNIEDANEPKLNITAAEVAHNHCSKSGEDSRKQLAGNRRLFRETNKQTILRQYINWPKIEYPDRVSSSGWVTKEDPLKDKKNQQERERRGELAMYRDELRKLLPQTKKAEKVATVTVLEAAKDYCVFLQQEVDFWMDMFI